MPTAVDGSFIIYNVDLFEQAGLDPDDPPSTWGEMLDAMRAIDALGDDIYGYWFSLGCAGCKRLHLPALHLGQRRRCAQRRLFRSDHHIGPDRARSPRVLQHDLGRGLVPEGASIDNGSNFTNAFAGGNIGMAGTGNFSLSRYKNEFPDINFDLFHIPGKEGGTASFGGGDVIAIATGTEHVEEAWRFIEWTLTEGPQIDIYAANGQIPVRLSLADNEYSQADPRFVTSGSALSVGHTPYTTVYNDLFNDPNGPWLEMLQVAILDGDIDGALELGQERFTRSWKVSLSAFERLPDRTTAWQALQIRYL